MTGHEGLDFQAPHGSNIYAAADGVISRIENDPSSGNYGKQVRITHEVGNYEYSTIYAHLLAPLSSIQVGQSVKRGDVIGYADSTGNSTGSHLHFTLKKRGASASGETDQPCDIISPEPFLDPFGMK